MISDDASIAYVHDLLIRPPHHRRGLGKELLKRALDRFAHVRRVVLITDNDPAQISF